MAGERLQKVMAAAGVASRRKCEALIAAGRVRVNGRIVSEQGVRVDSYNDKIEVDGRRIVREKTAYYVVHKPREMVSTLSDPEGRSTLNDILKRLPERLFPVGRLDYHTSGVLLATNDGAFSEALLRPSTGVPKVYLAKMHGSVDVAELELLRNGVTLDDGYVTKPAEAFVQRTEGSNSWVQITLKEGKNRQVHRMGDALNRRVMRLVRLSFADITSEGLRPGHFRELTGKELERLKRDFVRPHRVKKQNAADRRNSGEMHATGEVGDYETEPED
jgi:23S rRNA pseudouridine2605 synthase